MGEIVRSGLTGNKKNCRLQVSGSRFEGQVSHKDAKDAHLDTLNYRLKAGGGDQESG